MKTNSTEKFDVKQFEHAALVAVAEAAEKALAYAALCLEHPTSPACWNEHRKIVREARVLIQQLESNK